jgi:hypothetical protein
LGRQIRIEIVHPPRARVKMVFWDEAPDSDQAAAFGENEA